MRNGKKYLSAILFLAVMMVPTIVFAETEDVFADKNAVTVIGQDANDENTASDDAADDGTTDGDSADGDDTGDGAADDDTTGGDNADDDTGDGIEDDIPKSNWQKIDEDGLVYWQYVDEETGSFFQSEFVLIGERLYCFDENGYLMTGLIEVKDTSEELDGVYYAIEAGSEEDTPDNSRLGSIVLDAWVLLQDAEQTKRWRYFDGNGKVVNSKDGWNQIDGTWYWLENSVPTTGWKRIFNKWYYLSPEENGAMQIGWQTIKGRKYYLSNSQSDGSMKSGWQKIDGKWYYLSGSQSDGSLKIGWQQMKGKWYYLSDSLDDGAMKSGWHQLKGKWYYLGGAEDGAMKIGWQKIGCNWYYLSSSQNDGSMKYGWQKIGGKWYYLGDSEDGAMKTGWQKVGNYWYYMYSSGVMASSTWIGSYYVNSSGRWIEMDYVWPLTGYTYISSDYGYRTAPIAGASTNHNGIDIPAPGGTPIRAVADGTVVDIGCNGWNGNYIWIDHGDGLVTAYLHMSGFAVSKGNCVKAGQTIGYVGTTGLSTGNHLHLGFYENGVAVSPWNYLQRMR